MKPELQEKTEYVARRSVQPDGSTASTLRITSAGIWAIAASLNTGDTAKCLWMLVATMCIVTLSHSILDWRKP